MNTLIEYFRTYANEIKKMYKFPYKTTILEIGCNDGVFLRPLKKHGFNVIGVDPASNVIKTLKKQKFNVINSFFNETTSKRILRKYGKVDLITGTSSLAHNDDIHTILKGVKVLLKDDGVFIIQEHYLGDLIGGMQYDMIYHEHTNYYSLLSLTGFLKMYGMEVFKVRHESLRSGMMRYYCQNIDGGKKRVSKSVRTFLQKEKRQDLDKFDTYKSFSRNIDKTKKDLLKLINKLKKENMKIVGYGASGRANTIMAYCGITNEHIDFMVDDAISKHGAYTPGNHLRIMDSDILDDPKKRPDYAIMFAWPFFNEIKKKKGEYLKSGGKFILPLPSVKIISK